MSLLIKAGVTDFLALTDTPAAYTGQAAKAAVVNSAEDALEFVSVAAERQYPLFISTVLYNATKDQSWEELDCGVGKAIVYLKVELDAAIGTQFLFLPNGAPTPEIPYSIGLITYNGVTERVGYVMMNTDSDGKLKWTQKLAFPANTITVTLLAYWSNPPMPNTKIFDGVTVAAWTAMDIGVPNALAIIKVTRTDPTDMVNFYARLRGVGETKEVTYQDGCTSAVLTAVDQCAFLLVATDGEGKIEFYNVNAGRDFTVHLMAYIVGAVNRRIGVFSGNAPVAWTDLDTPEGKGIAYMRNWHSADAGSINMSYRENGETLEASKSPMSILCNCNPTLDLIGYTFVLLDEAGIVEWIAENAYGVDIRLEVLSR